MSNDKPAEPLQVEHSTVTKLVITGAPRLDPITVFLEDFGRRDCPTESDPNYQTAQGKITINCWDSSWNAYWGGMGPRTVAEFVADCGWDYILNCLDRGISPTVFSGNALHTLAKQCIVQRRRQQTGRNDWELGELSKGEARELWDDIDVLRGIESSNECWHQSRLLTELFGEEWHYPLDGKAVEENHAYTYLRRVVEAVQQALRQEQKIAAQPAPVEQAARAEFERAFVVQEGVYFSADRNEYRSMNGRPIERTDATDLNLRLQGWQARAALERKPCH